MFQALPGGYITGRDKLTFSATFEARRQAYVVNLTLGDQLLARLGVAIRDRLAVEIGAQTDADKLRLRHLDVAGPAARGYTISPLPNSKAGRIQLRSLPIMPGQRWRPETGAYRTVGRGQLEVALPAWLRPPEGALDRLAREPAYAGRRRE